jgi:hypothetical protein
MVPWGREIAAEFITLGKLYVLAEKLMDTAAKNAAIHALWATISGRDSDGHLWSPGLLCVEIIYAGTTRGSLARQLMAESWSQVKVDELIPDEDKLPKDFLHLVVALRPANKESIVRKSGPSRYLEKEE